MWSKVMQPWVDGSPSLLVTNVSSFTLIGLVEVEMFFCHVASRDHTIKGASDLVCGSAHPKPPP